jgi:hypothetical protein
MRVLAMFCVLLVGGMGMAQAVHVHGDWLPDNAVHASIPADASQGQGEEHCPLCVAMHTALPITMQVVPEPVREVVPGLTTHVLVAPQRLWSFAMFSRPPPVAERTLAASEASKDVSLGVIVAA